MKHFAEADQDSPVIKSVHLSDNSNGGKCATTGVGGKEPPSPYGTTIAQTAIQSIGLTTRNSWGPNFGPPKYALAVSLIFTKATEQTIMLGTPPNHVLSTSILWNSLLHDKRFRQVPMSEAISGDLVVESGGHYQATGYAGIVVDHGRIISNSDQGVQNNSSLVEIQHHCPGMVLFRYFGVQGHRNYPLANANFNPNEPRTPAGQPGGGKWATAPSTIVLSGGNSWTASGSGGKGVGHKILRDPAKVSSDSVQTLQPKAADQPDQVTAATRADEAKRFARLAEVHSEKAKDENQLAGPTALVFDGVGQPDEQDRHKLAAKEAQDIAEEMQRRAYILLHGTEDNYRKLVVDQYGIKNPELNNIIGYYAKNFNDQAALNWLKLQHPAAPPGADQIRKDVGMMALFPRFAKMGKRLENLHW